MSETFEAATGPSAPFGIFTGQTDPAEWRIPEPAREKLISLHQRRSDLFAQIPSADDVMEYTTIKLAHERRIKELTEPRGVGGGYGLDSSAPQVRHEQEKLAKATEQRTRLQKLKDARTPRWAAVAQLVRAVEDWLRAIPSNCELCVVEDAVPGKLLLKNETPATAITRYRAQLASLAAKLEHVRSAPWPAKVAIEMATKQIRAMSTPPDCRGAIDWLAPISFAMQNIRSVVRGEIPSLAFSETVDSTGLLIWLFERELIAKVTAEIKQASRDSEALDERQRAAQESDLLEQITACERAEVSLIWNMQNRDEAVADFRVGTSPAAVLGLQSIIVASRAAPAGTSPGHGYDVVGPH